MKKQILLFVLALLPLVANADQSGTCGNNLTWTYVESTGTLTISGTGAMNNYYNDSPKAPWRSYSIKKLILEDGITSIGNYAFYYCSGLTSVTIPNSVTSIGGSAFYNCSGLTSVHITDLEAWCKIVFSGSNSNPLTYAHHLFLNGNEVRNLVIPNSVTSLARTFSGCSGLTSVTIGNSVTSIGTSAFEGCSGLTSVTIPNSVTSIGDAAFYECSGLTSVTIPNSVTSIGDAAFWKCRSLTSVTIGNSVTSIGEYAFYECNNIEQVKRIINDIASWCEKDPIAYGNSSANPLNSNAVLKLMLDEETEITELVIPDGVNSIRSSAFYGCSGLTSVTIPNSVTSIGNDAFVYCSSLTSVIIGNSVTSIGNDAFWNCSSLTSVTIPNSVTSIGNYAFNGCSSLTALTIPNSVTSIGWNAFSECNNIKQVKRIINDIASWCEKDPIAYGNSSANPLNSNVVLKLMLDEETEITELVIPDGVNSIRRDAFKNCSGLTSVTIPNSVTSIGGSAFSGCSGLTSVTIPNSVTSIGGSAFYNCSGLTSVTIPNSVTSIGSEAFYGCSSLTTVTIPNSVTSIGFRTFQYCSGLTSVTIGNSVTSIGNYAFLGCSGLTAVNIPNSITSISESAFSECSSLTSVTIPNSVTSIAGEAFSGCSSLASVTITSSAISINSSAFSGCSELKTIYYNCKEIGNVIPSAIKGNITDVILGNEVTSIGERAFSGCSGLTSINIPNGVTSIGGSAFYNCSGLTSVTIPNSVTSIGSSAFYNCSGLTSVDIPNSVTSIGGGAFWGCSGLTSVTIPNSVTSIGNSAFYGCSSLTSITIPNSVTSIGGSAFSGCSGLTSVDIPNSVTSIGGSAFSGCSGLTSVTIPNSVTSIGGSTFYNCSGLTSVAIPNSVTSIGGSAFSGCSNLLTVNSKITEPFNCSNVFDENTCRKGTLYIPEGTKDLYVRFDGWREFLKIEEVGGTLPKYSLSFVVDNKELSKTEAEFGSTITPPTTDNEGNSVSWYTYPATMPAHDLVVYGMVSKAAAPTKYTITYVLDGQTYRSVTVDEGATVSKEKVPYKEGYTFNGWQNEPTTMPGRNVTVSGSFSVNTYRLSFIVDNQQLSTRNIAYGATITAPTKDNEGNTITWYTYPATMPAHDLVVYGMSVKEPEPEVFVWLTVNDSRSGYTKIKVKQGAEQTLNFTAEEGWKISNIFMDGRYVTSRLAEDGTFVTPVITGDTSIIIVYEEEAPSDARAATRSQAYVKVVSDGVVISNAAPDTRCIIYGSDGQQVVNTVINDGTRKIALQQGQVYILTINGRTLKFAL